MFEDNLLTPIIENNDKNRELVGAQFFINFINKLEGFKTKCKSTLVCS